MFKSGIFSKEENDFVIQNYQTMTQKEIGLQLNRKEASIKDRIKKLGLSKIPKQFWTEDELEILKYSWHRENDFMKHFPNRTFQSVCYKAWELGLKRDGRGGYDVNHDYFKTMDATKAYIIGLIAADGNIYSKRHRLTITLHHEDRYMLNRVKDEMKSFRPILERKTMANDFVITSKEIVQDLKEIGLIDNKSLTLDKLNIPDKYMNHFVRGYFDGDGCASYYCRKKDNKPQLDVTILGTEKFLTWISESINKHTELPLNAVNKIRSSNIYKLRYSGNTSLKFRDWIYKDSNIHLTRKYDKFTNYELDIRN